MAALPPFNPGIDENDLDLQQALAQSYLPIADNQSENDLHEIQRHLLDFDDGLSSSHYSSLPVTPTEKSRPELSFDDRDVTNATLPRIEPARTLPIPNWSDSDLSISAGPSRSSRSSGSSGSPAGASGFLHPLPTRKRALDADHTSSTRLFREPKSRKTTPTPRALENGASNNLLPDLDIQELLGLPDSDDLHDLEEEHKAAETWLKEKREQERRDAEFARSLQESFNQGYSEPSSLGHAAWNQPSSQSTSMLPPLKPAMRSPLAQTIFSAGPSGTLSHRRPAPPEPAPPKPKSYIDLSSDSDVEELAGDPFIHRHNTAWNNNRLGQVSLQNPMRYGSFTQCNFPAQTSGYSYGYGYGSTNPALNTSSHLAFDLLSAGLPSNMPGSFTMDAMSRATSALGPPFPLPYTNIGSNYDSKLDLYETRDPQETNDELKKLLENIRPDQDLDSNREGTPEAMQYPLLEHQKLGLAWMKSMEEGSNKGGILADDMGLGKTIQALALMVTRPSSDPERKTTLIIAPVALIQQWKREIEKKLKPGRHQLSVFVLHGEKRGATFNTLKKHDVVLTTFGTLASEHKRWEKADEMRRKNPQTYRNLSADAFQLPILGDNSKWYRVILDEAQCIKNKSTRSARACFVIKSTHRWCMSGTPMMNNVDELFSLICFLRIGPYNSSERFSATFSRPLKNYDKGVQERAMGQLQALLKAILLRRMKTSKIDGKPILQLPPRTTEKVHAVFSEDEKEFYSALEGKIQLQFNRYLKAGTVGRNYSNVLVLLLRLRQCCCHPHLIKDFGVETNANTSEIDLMANAKLLESGVVMRLRENEASECPVCIDAVENAIIFFPCGHCICAECWARVSDPSQLVAMGEDNPNSFPKCPNCRTRIDPKKITDNVSFKKVFCPEETGDDAGNEEQPPKAGEDEVDESSDSDSEDDDDNGDGDIRNFIVDDDEDPNAPSRPKKSKRKDRKGKGKAHRDKKRTLADLKKDSLKNAKAKQKYLKHLAKNWITSAKIDKTMEVLHDIQMQGHGEKTIIFSQFTSLLDLLEVPIVKEGWGYRRYDGSMKPVQRNEAVIEFSDNPNCKIMLVSLKAGNAGLNLTAASRVIIFDPFWNPYIEEQAIDRAHRIGQMRPVIVHRILVENTVEDRILELQDKKRELIEGALDEGASRNIGRLGTRELAYLFGVGPR
ncbi:hypothetical protein AJ80_06574 [Polytolypa hystricis UAMH7299]|uniref:SWI/SNF family DNA-dependent ATPase Ris1 n=1 Tax=Polytolypa hystricis (strain UAMH7299) TaxID=1447883 RepID=A0A2B7XV92_POLH7|nr:hypothetical protein AJ80_06574 [Polytolypa hystricis UAMH7299]